MSNDVQRLAHVDSNMALRTLKARKIETLLGLDSPGTEGTLLEIGTGSGGIAEYFAHQAFRPWSVTAVDVVDNRQQKGSYAFCLLHGCLLPFPDQSFDVVISNHVIEHVGDSHSQALHLAELKRVLKPDGLGYLAVPNRWMLVEPHYGVAFLSWLPKVLRTPYLRLFRKQATYDCEPLSMGEVERSLKATGLRYANLCMRALRLTIALEGVANPAVRSMASVPDALLKLSLPAMPTLIYRLEHPDGHL